MTNWQIFKVRGVSNWQNDGRGSGFRMWNSIELDKNVEYSNGYEKRIHVEGLRDISRNECGRSGDQYIEIDIDKTKCKNKGDIISGDTWRKVPNDVVARRNDIMSASSSNSEVVAMNRELMDRVDRGQQTYFTYQLEDPKTGLKHSWIYKRN